MVRLGLVGGQKGGLRIGFPGPLFSESAILGSMDTQSLDLRIDAQRLQDDFEQLAAIGSTGDGGVHRPALSASHLQARHWFRQRIEAAGLDFHMDGAGNHSARLPCDDPRVPTLLLGSHLDSVPYGGCFDGSLGVLAALEVLRTVREAGIRLPVHLEAIDFTDEEGTLVGLLGSRALAGTLTSDDLRNPRGGRQALLDGLVRAGLTEAGVLSARRDPHSLAGFLEVHIEQGSRLVAQGADIGIVTALVGIGSLALTFTGRADHAGTTPMDARKDAGLGAAAFILATREVVMAEFPLCVVNVGRLSLAPGALNIVPARSEVGVEYRAPDERRMQALKERLLSLAREAAGRYDLKLQVADLGAIPATPCAASVREVFHAACDALDLLCMPMTSGAGHDTMALAAVCPAGMIFVPSSGGSHSPTEDAAWEDCVNGANVLLLAALNLC